VSPPDALSTRALDWGHRLEIPALAQLEVLPAHHKRLPAKAKQIISHSLALRPSCTLPDGETAFIIGVLLCCSALCLFTYSGPRTIFAACSFAIGLRMVLCARSERTVTSTEPCEHEREQLRPKLALLYLGHWSVDLTHLLIGGRTSEDAAAIGLAMLRSVKELAILFGLATAMLGAESSPATSTTLSRVVAAQGVLALRAYVTWHALSTAPPAAWPGHAHADEYAVAAAGGQVLLPLLTMCLGYGWRCWRPGQSV